MGILQLGARPGGEYRKTNLLWNLTHLRNVPHFTTYIIARRPDVGLIPVSFAINSMGGIT